MNVAQYIAEFFVEKNIQHVFGFQGGSILKILDEMIATGKIEYIQNYHEQASSFAADAYSRVTGNIGCAIATSGPGAINLLSGIANAHFDSYPCIFLTGQDYTAHIDKPHTVRLNGFQDLDIVSMVKPITKYAKCIIDPNEITYELQKAYWIAKSGRPGSVLLDIPVDVQFQKIDMSKTRAFVPAKPVFQLDKISTIIEKLKMAKRPVILAGGGIRIANVVNEFKIFADRVGAPVVSTLNGLDTYHKNFSFAGLHGNSHSNLTVLNADLLIVVGSRLGQRQVGKNHKKYTNAKIIHIDVDKSEFERAIPEDDSIYSDLKVFLDVINEKLKDEKLPSFENWFDMVLEYEKKYSNNSYINDEGIDPVKFVREIAKYFSNDAILTSDVGQNQMWVAQGVNLNGKQRLLNSSGLGAMGYSLPAAIGARYADQKKQVLAFTGDGGLQMNIQELLLVGHKKLNIKTIVFNNGTLGMMREVQERYFNSHFFGSNPEEFICVDLKALSDAYNLNYLGIKTEADFEKIADVIADEKPCKNQFE